MHQQKNIISQNKAAGHGADHWWQQKTTAVILLLITAFMFSLAHDIGKVSSKNELIALLKAPHNILFFTVFVGVSFWHAALGMQVIIEDYIHCKPMKILLILLMQLIAFFTVVAFIVAAFYLMNI